MESPASAQSSLFDAAPALFLDRFEELRMELSDQQLIAEAIETNHAGVRKDRTLDRYRDHLVHYSQYLGSVFGLSFYTARRKHVRMFMNHLAKPGGPKPHDSRLQCAWCKTRGYPDGRSGPGWSPSYRKSYPQREGTAHRRGFRGLEAQRHSHDPPPLCADEIRAARAALVEMRLT